jgi:hypothetical protein
MIKTLPNADQSAPPSAAAKDKAAKEDWENEGGAMRDGPSTQGPAVVRTQTADPASQETAAVDAMQDRLMIVKSSDGAPPPRAWRLAGWHWLAVLVPLLAVLGGLVWVGIVMGVGAALVGFVLLAVMGGAAAPVWGAGLLRGSEEREARAEVRAEEGLQPGTGPSGIIPTRRSELSGPGLRQRPACFESRSGA